MTPFTIYLWGIADNVHMLFSMLAVTGCIMSGLLCFILFIAGNAKDGGIVSSSERSLKFALPAAIVFGILSALAPDSKTVAAMVVIPAIAQSEAIQKDAPELYKMAIERLKETLAEKP